MLDVDALRRIAPKGRADILQMVADLPAFPTPIETAHFVAQTAHESDGYKTTVEYASGAAYEGRKDLGNTKRGDGKRFKGRGIIQLTGRSNYEAFSKWATANRPGAPDFVKSPEKVADAPWAALAALWFWQAKKIGRKIKGEPGDLLAVTKVINGGTNGLEDRRTYFTRTLHEMGITVTSQPAPQNDAMLQEGDEGAAVRALQEDLRSLGYNDIGLIDGKFGNKTRDMVKALQTDRGLFSDGKVGPKTWASLREDRTPRPISRERQNATVEDLRQQGSGIIKLTDNLKTAATVAGIGATGTAGYQASTEQADPTTVSTQLSTTAEKALEQADRARDFTDRATDLGTWAFTKLGSIGAWFIERPWLLVLAGLAVAVWVYASRTQQQRVEMHRQGRD